jgi:hypothetical protein
MSPLGQDSSSLISKYLNMSVDDNELRHVSGTSNNDKLNIPVSPVGDPLEGVPHSLLHAFVLAIEFVQISERYCLFPFDVAFAWSTSARTTAQPARDCVCNGRPMGAECSQG